MTGYPWFYTVSNLAELWERLEGKGQAPSDPYEFLANPQNWDAEWQQMIREEGI